MYDRNKTVWRSQYEDRLVKDLDDEHVQNIVLHIESYPGLYSPGILALFLQELKIRKLRKIKKRRPHKDPDGNLRVWSRKAGRSVRLENMKETW